MKINLYAGFRSIAGSKTVDIALKEGSSVAQLVQCLVETFPALKPKLLDDSGELASYVHIFINGRDAPTLPDAFQTTLSPGDTIDIFPPVAGGSSDR